MNGGKGKYKIQKKKQQLENLGTYNNCSQHSHSGLNTLLQQRNKNNEVIEKKKKKKETMNV